ncbi:MAG: energy-coupling factor ABC transporter permease [Bryobacterales bacterium]|nr:energy-coupling factor ABC transporter permease [Bryobacterales bacterium]
MHVADGIVSVPLSLAAHGVSLGGVYWLGRGIDPAEVTRMGLLASASFVVSLIHFPLAGTSVHLGLFGLLGILLGKRAFPVLYATLLAQTLLFQHGGLLSLGLNVFNMGTGALLGALIWRAKTIPETPRAAIAGFVATLVPALLMAAEFELSGYGKGFYYIAGLYTVVAAAEGAVTASIVAFFRRVSPRILAGSPA